MLIKMTEPKLSSRAKSSVRAGTWQPRWLGMQASYPECHQMPPSPQFSVKMVCGYLNHRPLLNPDLLANPQGLLLPSLHTVPASEAEGILDPGTAKGPEESSVPWFITCGRRTKKSIMKRSWREVRWRKMTDEQQRPGGFSCPFQHRSPKVT